MMSWCTFLRIFVTSLAGAPHLLCLVLLLLQTTQVWEKSCQAVIRNPARRQSGFLSVSDPGPCRVWGYGRGSWFLNWAHSLALSKWTAGTALVWASFRNPQLYSMVTHHTPPPLHVSCLGIFQFRPRRSLTTSPNVRPNFTSPPRWPVCLGLTDFWYGLRCLWLPMTNCKKGGFSSCCGYNG